MRPKVIHETDFDRFTRLEKVRCFRSIREMKSQREEEARTILVEHAGKFENDEEKDLYLRKVFNLVDYGYPYIYNGVTTRGPWFGHLLKPNAETLFDIDYTEVNRWLRIVSDPYTSETFKLERLREDDVRISGLNVGFITLMLYLLDKENCLIWFDVQHEGLQKLCPTFETFTGKSSQYPRFNDLATKFADRYHFEHTEMDWVLTANLTEFTEPAYGIV